VGDVEKVIRLSPIAHDAPLTVSFHAGDFKESMQVVNLLLAGTFLSNRGYVSVLFFWQLFLGTVAENAVDALMELALVAGHMVLFYRILLIMYMLPNLTNAEIDDLCVVHNA
jgi:hypothetical protein